MNTTRIESAIDTHSLANKRIAIVGCGAVADLCRDLVRCGVGEFILNDFDFVSEENICRQGYAIDQIEEFKGIALAYELKRINPDVRVIFCENGIDEFNEAQVEEVFRGTDLFVAATDSHIAQARVNQIALMLDTPAIWIGLYRGGRAGEVAYWKPGLRSCYRCLFPSRYRAAEKGPIDPSSDGATILDVKIIDAIAGHVIIGLLTEGADNRFGRLIDRLGKRQVLQVKIDPDWSLNGSDPVRDYLRVPIDSDGYVSFCTVAREDLDPVGCPDCVEYRVMPF